MKKQLFGLISCILSAAWRQCLKIVKAVGLNAVSAYLLWNSRQTTPGELLKRFSAYSYP
jgi:hypothetical protein